MGNSSNKNDIQNKYHNNKNEAALEVKSIQDNKIKFKKQQYDIQLQLIKNYTTENKIILKISIRKGTQDIQCFKGSLKYTCMFERQRAYFKKTQDVFQNFKKYSNQLVPNLKLFSLQIMRKDDKKMRFNFIKISLFQYEDLDDYYKIKDQQFNNLHKQYKNKKSQIQHIKNQSKIQMNQQIQQIQKQMKKYKQQTANYISQISIKNESLVSQLQRLQKQNKLLKKQDQESKKQIQEINETSNVIKSCSLQKSNQILSLKAALQNITLNMCAAQKQHQNQIQQLKNKIFNIKTENQANRSQLQVYKSKQEQKAQQENHIKIMLQQKDKELIQKQNRIATEFKIKVAQKQKQNLQQSIISAQKISDIQLNFDRIQTQKKALSKDLQIYNQKLEQKQNSIQLLNQLFKEQKNKLQANQKLNQSLQQQNETLKLDIQKISNQNINLEKDIKSLQKKLILQQQKIVQVQKQKQNFNEKRLQNQLNYKNIEQTHREQLIKLQTQLSQKYAQKTRQIQSKFKTKLQQIERKKQQSLQKDIQQKLKLIRDQYQQKLTTSLFSGDVFQQKHNSLQKKYLIQQIQKFQQARITFTKLLYRLDEQSNVNFHYYLDLRPRLLLVIKLKNGRFIAGYSRHHLQKGNNPTSGGLIMSLTNLESFTLKENIQKRNAIVYDQYYIIFGNSEIRLRFKQEMFFSNFGILNAHYDNRGQKVHMLLGQQKERESVIETYEFFQVNF